MYKRISIALIFLLSLQVVSAENPTVLELLDKYAANQDKLKSFIVKTKSVRTRLTQDASTPKEGKSEKLQTMSEFRYLDSGKDKCAYSSSKKFNLGEDGIWIPKHGTHIDLWDSKRYYEYYRGPSLKSSNVHIFDEYKIKYKIGDLCAEAGPLLGNLSNDHDRFDPILRQSESISVRSELERIGSVDCYVIDSKSKHGTYTVWLDPEHGYGIAKAIVHKEPEDIFRGRKISSFKDGPSIKGITYFIENVRFENIEGIWIPVEFDARSVWEHHDSTFAWHTQHEIVHIDIDPNHAELQSFVLDVQNGTRVIIPETPGIRYTWQDTMKFVVDEWDGSTKYVPKDWSILVGVGKPLPKFEGIKLSLTAEQTKDSAILFCFFDMNQRPSRRWITQLAQKARELKGKRVTIVAVQASEVKENSFSAWIKKNAIPFPTGLITANIEKTRFTWGVRSLPWLILTDRQHVVTAEGFSVNELYDKLKASK